MCFVRSRQQARVRLLPFSIIVGLDRDQFLLILSGKICEAIDLVRNASKALSKAAMGREVPPYIRTPTLKSLFQLRNVDIRLSLVLARDPQDSTYTPRRKVYLTDALADLKLSSYSVCLSLR
jgi:hypothetical protein